MLIYEVNLSVKSEVYVPFVQWLQEHIADMLELGVFTKAQLFKDSDNPLSLTVHYWCQSKEELDFYFEQYANKMRQDGLEKFPQQFTATRRVLIEE